jgi:hypothetical protein
MHRYSYYIDAPLNLCVTAIVRLILGHSMLMLTFAFDGYLGPTLTEVCLENHFPTSHKLRPM